MKRYNKEEERILSAKEIACYLHCPENWRLVYEQEVILEKQLENKSYQEEKKIWLADFDAARYLTWATNVIIFMIFFIVIFYIFTQNFYN